MAVTNKLTEVAIKKTSSRSKSYKIADGRGMYLKVMPSGSKYWRLKYRYGGKEKRLALGVYPTIYLANARSKRQDAKLTLANGVNLGNARKIEKLDKQHVQENTFEAITIEFIEITNISYFTVFVLIGYIGGSQIKHHISLSQKGNLREYSYGRWILVMVVLIGLAGCLGELDFRFAIYSVIQIISALIAAGICFYMVRRTSCSN